MREEVEEGLKHANFLRKMPMRHGWSQTYRIKGKKPHSKAQITEKY